MVPFSLYKVKAEVKHGLEKRLEESGFQRIL